MQGWQLDSSGSRLTTHAADFFPIHFGGFTVGNCSSAGCVHPRCPSLPGSAHASLCLTSPAAIAHTRLHLHVTSSNKQRVQSIKSGVLRSWFLFWQMIALVHRYSEFDRIDYVDMKPFPGHLCGVTMFECLSNGVWRRGFAQSDILFVQERLLIDDLVRRQNNRPSLYQQLCTLSCWQRLPCTLSFVSVM